MMQFDYTKEASQDTLKGGSLQGYRLMHWLSDILRNWFSDPINIKDERLARLLFRQDGDEDTQLKAVFDIGTPYSKDTKKACTTPMILVSLGDTKYPVTGFNAMGAGPIALNGATPASLGIKYKTITCIIYIITETYDGTVLLANLIEDFLNVNEKALIADNGTISEFHVLGLSAPSEVPENADATAKPAYQAGIQISVTGGISWTTDTQGPVFRGVSIAKSIK